MPMKVALTADRTNRPMVRRSVGMPALRALTLSPPMAKIQLPSGVWCITT
nr:hypothetical protein [Thetidibacter halocola]